MGALDIWGFSSQGWTWWTFHSGIRKWLNWSRWPIKPHQENEKSPDTSYAPAGLAEAAPNLFRTVSFSSSKKSITASVVRFQNHSKMSALLLKLAGDAKVRGTTTHDGYRCSLRTISSTWCVRKWTYSWQVWKRISENSKFKDGIEFKMEILTDQSGELSFKGKTRTRQTQTWPSCQCKNQLALRIVTGGYTSRAYVDAVQVAVSLFHWSYSKLARSIPRDFLRILFVSSHLV